MIAFPEYWKTIGQPIVLSEIDEALRAVVAGIDCSNLSYSGGIDSSLLLHYILETKGEANLYTAVNDPDHPDLYYAGLGREWFEEKHGNHLPHMPFVIPGCEGNELVKRYYERLALMCGDIIAGDVIDELACGYHAHQNCPDDGTYRDFLSRLQEEHLRPLNENSGNVRVHLPYAAPQIIDLMMRIPLAEKVSPEGRKLIIQALAQGKVPPGIIERRKYGFGTTAQGEKLAV